MAGAGVHRLRAAEAVLAEISRTRPDIGCVRQAIAAIRRFLRELGVNMALSDNDIIASYILPARRFVEGGAAQKRGAKAEIGSEKPEIGNPQPAFSLTSDEADAEFLSSYLAELSSVDAMFKYPKSMATTLAGALTDVDPTIRDRGQEPVEKDEKADGAIKKHKFTNGNGNSFFVYESADDRIWIDVSWFWSGTGGGAIYAAVGDYAANTGKVFGGDPQGLSADATIRRSYNMLASALKHGTTKHLDAAREQLRGNSFAGIPPLKWEGNDVEKVKALADTLVAYAERNIPELAKYRYDFDARRFVDGEGVPVSRADLEALTNAGRDRKAKVGGNSIRAGIFLASLVRSASGARPGLLEQALRQPDQLVTEGGLDVMFSLATPAAGKVMNDLRDRFGAYNDTKRTFNGWWHKTVGTQYHKAWLDADYKQV